MLADNLSEQMDAPIVVAGLPEVIQGLRRHIFNTDVYPDFFNIPTPERPDIYFGLSEAWNDVFVFRDRHHAYPRESHGFNDRIYRARSVLCLCL